MVRIASYEPQIDQSHGENRLSIIINKLMLTWLMIFRDTSLSILVFVNENYCLCTCFTELYLFHWLLVVPLAIFIAAPGCFQSNINIACRNTENATRKYHSLLKITDNKTINSFTNKGKLNLNITNSLLRWSVNGISINHCKFGACQKWEPVFTKSP